SPLLAGAREEEDRYTRTVPDVGRDGRAESFAVLVRAVLGIRTVIPLRMAIDQNVIRPIAVTPVRFRPVVRAAAAPRFDAAAVVRGQQDLLGGLTDLRVGPHGGILPRPARPQRPPGGGDREVGGVGRQRVLPEGR